MEDGSVVICSTGQCGSVIYSEKDNVWVLLRNSDIWVGPGSRLRIPQDQADMDACPINVERIEAKRTVSDRD